MKKVFRWMICLLFVVLLSGCEKKEDVEETSGYKVYYVNTEGTQLVSADFTPDAQNFEEIMTELTRALATPAAGTVSVLKKDVVLQGYQRGIDALRMDFSEEYYLLDSLEEVLLRAAVVRTFSQIPGVVKIMITVNGEQLTDTDGNPVEAMDQDDFIDTEEGGINSYQYAKLSLYYEDKENGCLKRENRTIHYSSNMVLEDVVLEQLFQGPDSPELQAVFSESVKILSIHIEEGICTVDLDDTCNTVLSESHLSAEDALMTLVNALCDTCDDITGVRIRINGENDILFRGEIPLNQVFSMDLSHVEENLTEQLSQSEGETESAAGVSQDAESDADAQTETVFERTTDDKEESAAEPILQNLVGVSPDLGKTES